MRMTFRIALGAVVVAAVVNVSCAAAARVPIITADGVRFTLARPGAKSVAVAGTFNDWSASSHPLTRNGSGGVWVGIVMLPPGEHLFMFVVDGTEWVAPPLAEDHVDDGFGSRNGVVIVRSRER